VANTLFARLIGKKERPNAAIETVLAGNLFHSVFQPLVDLRTRQIFAYESLVRPDTPEFKSPPALLAAAVNAGRVGELGRRLRKQAVEGCPGFPLFLNLHPHEFADRFLVLPDDPIFWHDPGVYLEITESVPLHYFDQCYAVIRELRSKGVHLAVDDLGAGYSNLKYISDLEPDIVKIDRDLIAGMREGTRQFRLVRAIAQLCRDMGAKVVCEGIETAAELDAVIAAGADYGQGYLLARPAAPLPSITWPGAEQPAAKASTP
jgi:EAL domain-containing protein (putative c-di-GMP-specific phosphodiesterase class I)